MATIIIAKNQIASTLTFRQLSIPDGQLAGFSQVTLTTWNTLAEIQRDSQLLNYIQDGYILLNRNGADLTKNQSINVTNTATTVADPALIISGPGLSTDNSVTRWDGTDGYTIQSSGVTLTDGDIITDPVAVDFDSGASKPAYTEGRIFYDNIEKALAVYNDEAEVTHQLGQEGFIRVYNNSGGTITNGSAVYIDGYESVEFRPTIELAVASARSTAAVAGIATHDIENNSFGYITYWGVANDLNTSSFSEGDALFLDSLTPGALTSTVPQAPSFEVRIGNVIRSHATEGRVVITLSAELGTAAGDATEIVVTMLKDTAGTINPGEAVYVEGFSVGQGLTTIELADASAATTMPALGMARDAITNNTSGAVVVSGTLTGQNTASFSVGDELYVSETAGVLTSVKPTGAALVQKIGVVARSHASSGVIEVFGAGRVNDLPNLASSNVWLGNGSSVPTATSRSGIDDTAIHDNVASEISAVTEKVSPVSADLVLIEDSEAGNVKKRVQLGNIPGGGGDHGGLTGLADDDHPQYYNDSRIEALLDGYTTDAEFTSHTGDAAIHFTEASIDHGSIAGLGDDDHPQYYNDIRIEALLDGYTTDAEFTAHTGDATIHFTEASIDHGSIAGLGDDDHPQYYNDTRIEALLDGYTTDAEFADHSGRHDPGGADALTTAAPGATGVATASGEGVAASFARSDHTHQSNTAPANVTKAAAAIGTSGEPARADHKHDITTAAPTTGIGGANSEGVSTSLARSDHNHALRTTTGPTDLTVGAISDGQFLTRSGTTIIGAAPTANPSITTVNAAGDITTTSTTDVLATSMTITPGTAATYLVWFNTNTSNDTNGTSNAVSIYSGASGSTTQVTNSERLFTRGNQTIRVQHGTTAVVVLSNAAHVIEARWRASAGTGTMGNRILTAMRVA